MAKLTAAKQKSRSIVFAALSKYCGKLSVRSDLDPGEAYRLKASVTATVGRSKVAEEIVGSLTVGHPTTTNRSTPAPAAEIVASLLKLIPEQKRAQLLRDLQQTYKIDGVLPYEKRHKDEAEVWLSSLRILRPAKRAGSVSFSIE